MRATREALEKEKEQLESIQIDLGVNMMTGNVLREKVNYEFNTKDFQKTIELLATMRSEHRSEKLCGSLMRIVAEVQFFQQVIIPLTKEDKLGIAKRLRYQFFPKGTPIRKALDKQYRWCYILCGKVACAMPTEEEAVKRAKKMGLELDMTTMSIAKKRQTLNRTSHDHDANEGMKSTLSSKKTEKDNPLQRRNSHVDHVKAIASARKLAHQAVRNSRRGSEASHNSRTSQKRKKVTASRAAIQQKVDSVTKLLTNLVDDKEIDRIRS